MKPVRFLLAPVFSIFDFNVYREARNEKFGTGILYGLYLSGLFCLAMTLFAIIFMPKVDLFVDWLKSEWPGMTLTATGMKLDKSGRITLTHPKFGPLVTMDDSIQTITETEMGSSKMFVTSTLIYSQTARGMQARSLPGVGANVKDQNKNAQLHIEGKKIHGLYQKLKWTVTAVFIFGMFIFGFVMRLITGLIFGSVGFLIQLAIPRNLDFEKLFVLASFSFSIGLIFGIFQYVPLVARFFPGGMGLVLSLVYFGIAITVQPKITTPIAS